MKIPGIAGTLLLLLLFGGAASADRPAAGAGSLTIEPQVVSVGLFYDGADIEIRAELPAECEAAVRLTGRAERLELKRKGKVGGVLWMSVGEVAVDDVPSVYFLATSAPLASLAPSEELARWRLGYEGLFAGPPEDAALHADVARLKEHDHLYAVMEGGLQPFGGAADSPALRTFSGSFRVPARAPAGEYQAELVAFTDREGRLLASTTLRIEHVGIVKAMKELAVDHGLLYGIAAVICAVAAGLLTGLIFSGKSAGGH